MCKACKVKPLYLKGSADYPWWLLIVRKDTNAVVMAVGWKTRKEARAGQKFYTDSPELIREVPIKVLICKDFECLANQEIK